MCSMRGRNGQIVGAGFSGTILSKQLIDFCELQWEDQCLDFHKTKRQVRTASIEQVRQPINKKSIGAWKKYEKYFTELVGALNIK